MENKLLNIDEFKQLVLDLGISYAKYFIEVEFQGLEENITSIASEEKEVIEVLSSELEIEYSWRWINAYKSSETKLYFINFV